MNKIQSLCPGVQEVANEFERRLTVLNLPIKTIRSYFITVRKLSSFMIEKEVEQYSPEIGSDFLIYLAKKEGFSQNYINCHANVIRRLDECLSDSFWVNPYVFSSYVIKHDDIKESYDQIIHDLERLGLKQTIGYTKRCLVALDIYMAEYHIDKYETSVGTDYLSCMKEVTGMALKAFSFRYIEVINRLNSVFEGKMPDYYVPKSYRFCCLELENAMNDTIERLRTFGYTERVLCQVRTTISNLDMYMNQRGISTYDKQVGSAFLDYYETRYVEDKNINRDIAAISALSHFNDTFFGEEARRYHRKSTIEIPFLFEKPFNQYIVYCKGNRNKATTLYNKRLCCVRFFNALQSLGCTSIEELTFPIVVNACASLNSEDWVTVKDFLKYCALYSITEKDFSAIVPHKKRKYVLPPNYTKEERHLLESAPDRTSALGKRDYAIILLINRLGLRSSDVVNMTFSNLDRVGGKIIFNQYKNDVPHILPLLDIIANAIDDYVNNARPKSDSEFIFLMAYAPYQRLERTAIHCIFTKYLLAAGIDITTRKHGGHAFRASASTAMVNNGMSYEETRFLLGHRDRNMIKHYATQDIESLRMCALVPSPPSGNYKALLDFKEVIE